MNVIAFTNGEGEPVYTSMFSNDADAEAALLLGGCFDATGIAEHTLFNETFFKNGVVLSRVSRPTQYHSWNLDSESWVLDLGLAAQNAKSKIDQERIRRNFSPITYDGKPLDADATAQNNLSNKLQEVRERVRLGIPMPPELRVWKGEDNVVHVWETDQAYLDWLSGFTIALSERGTKLYAAAWQHKANIDALVAAEDEEGLLSYDVTVGW